MHRKLSTAHVNVRSLIPHVDELRNLISPYNYDLVAISETWISRGCNTDAVAMNGYTFVNEGRVGRGGGVGFYLANNLKHKVIITSNSIEQLWLEIDIDGVCVVVGVVYRPPHLDHKLFLDDLESTISTCLAISENIICFGDLNIDMLKPNETKSLDLSMLLTGLQFTQVISSPTRTTEHSKTLIDLILVSNEQLVADSGVKSSEVSDHDLVFCMLNVEVPQIFPIFKFCRNLKNVDVNAFRVGLGELPLNGLYYMHNIDDKLMYLNNCIKETLEHHAPLRKVRFTRPPAPWLTPNIKLLISLRDNAKKRFKKTNNPHHWEYYKSLRNFTTLAIRNEKRVYYKHAFESCDKKTLWNNLRFLNFRNKSVEIPDNIKNPDQINNFFVNSVAGTSGNKSAVMNYYSSNRANGIVPNSFNFRLITQEDVRNHLNRIKSNSVGVDGINAYVLQLCFPVIVNHITHILNCCIEENYFPEQWKTAYVVPLPKSANITGLKDLRPISILPAMSKLLESVLNCQLREYLSVHNILPTHQSGFRQHYSCTTALIQITDDIMRATDNGLLTALVLLDYSKAFDSIDHEILMAVLDFVGLSKNAILMLKNYILNRKQIVKIGDSLSSPLSLHCGVPQGSVLGPLLFSLYTCNLHSCIKYCNIHMYADDTQLYYSFEESDVITAMQRINSDLASIYRAASDHSLSLNAKKTIVLLFGNRNKRETVKPHIKLVLNNVGLLISDHARNLGLILDNSFRFREHIIKCTQRSYSSLRALYPHRSYLPRGVKVMLCETLVLSQFNYCSPIIGPSLDSADAYKIQKVQNCCIRFIYGIRKFEHVSHKLFELRWLNMRNRMHLQMCNLFYSIVTSKEPTYLYRKLCFRNDVHSVNVRSRHLVSCPAHKTALFRRSFTYCMYKFYNSYFGEITSLKKDAFHRVIFKSLFDEQRA